MKWAWLVLLAACSRSIDPQAPLDPAPPPVDVAPGEPNAADSPAESADPIDSTSTACEATSPRAGKVDVVVTPDDGDAPVLALINGAKTSIDVTIYQLSSRNVIGALTAAAKRGVSVRVIQDRKEASDYTMSTLRDSGAVVKTSSTKFRFTHQKTVLVDGQKAFVFSGNLDRLSFGSGRNFAAVLDDADDLADLTELFDADWNARAPNLSCTRLVVSPVNARARILALIASASKSLDVEAMYVTDYPVIDAIADAQTRGVTVRVLLNDPSHGMGDSSDAVARLTKAGIPVRRSGALFVHAKLLVVDGVHAFVGSENFSDNSLDSNREAGVVVSTPSANVARIVSTFEGDWRNSPIW